MDYKSLADSLDTLARFERGEVELKSTTIIPSVVMGDDPSEPQQQMFGHVDDPFARRRASRQARKELLLKLPPKGRRPRCAKCSREMSPNFHWDGLSEAKFGFMGNNYFCTQSCGFAWALTRLAEDLKHDDKNHSTGSGVPPT